MPATTARPTLRQILRRGATPDIGQITPETAKVLKRLVRKGKLATYRGYWDTLLPFTGIGPLKTIYALPEVAARMNAFAKAA